MFAPGHRTYCSRFFEFFYCRYVLLKNNKKVVHNSKVTKASSLPPLTCSYPLILSHRRHCYLFLSREFVPNSVSNMCDAVTCELAVCMCCRHLKLFNLMCCFFNEKRKCHNRTKKSKPCFQGHWEENWPGSWCALTHLVFLPLPLWSEDLVN